MRSPEPRQAGAQSGRIAAAPAAIGRHKGAHLTVEHVCDCTKLSKPPSGVMLVACTPTALMQRHPGGIYGGFQRPAACRPDHTGTAKTAKRHVHLLVVCDAPVSLIRLPTQLLNLDVFLLVLDPQLLQIPSLCLTSAITCASLPRSSLASEWLDVEFVHAKSNIDLTV